MSLPLSIIINNYFKKGKFPTLLKIAKICPIKKKTSMHCNHYKSILILPVMSKVMVILVRPLIR